jgi:hypothetical protein
MSPSTKKKAKSRKKVYCYQYYVGHCPSITEVKGATEKRATIKLITELIETLYLPKYSVSINYCCFCNRCRWEDNIKMGLREIGIDGANWIQLAQDRVQWQACVNTIMNLRVP